MRRGDQSPLRSATELEVVNCARVYYIRPASAKAWAFTMFTLGWRPAEINSLRDRRSLTKGSVREYHRQWQEAQRSRRSVQAHGGTGAVRRK
ncbi:MAG: hypothetical protein HY531_02790 [Chloroflexi bacterium]|nr:hypothetical protein [Chloroflexota bacterium]